MSSCRSRSGLLALIFLLWAASASAGISRIGKCSAQAATCTFDVAPARYDVIIVFAHRDGNTTAPSLLAGYTNIANAGANSNSARIAYKVAVGTETTTGSWANATSVAAVIYRGVDIAPRGPSAAGGALSNSMSYTGITLGHTDNTSWVLGCGGHRSATNVGTNAPSGLTLVTSATDIACFDSNATTSTWTTQTAGVDASSGWRTYVVEVRARTNATGDVAQLVQHVTARPNREMSPNTDSGTAFYVRLPNPVLSNNLVVIDLVFPYDAARTVNVTDNIGTNTWTQVTAAPDDTGNVFSAREFYSDGTASGTQVFTITFDADVYGVVIAITEYSGMATSSALDTSTSAAGTATDPDVKAGSITPGVSDTIVHQFGLMDGTSTALGINKCSGLAGGNGFSLLGASREICFAVQSKLHASGAINPTFSANITVDTIGQPWITLAAAYKTSAGAGTTPTAGIRIQRIIQTTTADAGLESTTDTIEFPGSGNLAVVMSVFGSGQATINAITDGTNSFTMRSVSASYPQMGYLPAASSDQNGRRITFTLSSAYAMNVELVDIVGAHGTTPFDTQAEASFNQTSAHQSLTPLPTITPSTANGLILVAMNEGHGPIGSMSAPSGSVLHNVHYDSPGHTNWHTDTSAADSSGDGYAHYYNPSTSSVTFTWVDAVPDLVVSSLTRSGSTATVTITASNHDRAILGLYSNGDEVTIAGAVETEYNGTFAIGGLSATGFTYTVSGSPSTPATGTITATQTTDSVGVAWAFKAPDAGGACTPTMALLGVGRCGEPLEETSHYTILTTKPNLPPRR